MYIISTKSVDDPNRSKFITSGPAYTAAASAAPGAPCGGRRAPPPRVAGLRGSCRVWQRLPHSPLARVTARDGKRLRIFTNEYFVKAVLVKLSEILGPVFHSK